jgi:hypothetical protein
MCRYTLPPILNMAITLVALYLFRTYGALCGWWTRLYGATAELQARGSTFHAVGDGVYYGVLALLCLNLGHALVMVNTPQRSKLATTAVVCSASALLICILVAF